MLEATHISARDIAPRLFKALQERGKEIRIYGAYPNEPEKVDIYYPDYGIDIKYEKVNTEVSLLEPVNAIGRHFIRCAFLTKKNNYGVYIRVREIHGGMIEIYQDGKQYKLY